MSHSIRVLLLASVSCASQTLPLAAPTAPPVHDLAIVPGVRVGPIALGMNAKSLSETMGTPQTSGKLGTDYMRVDFGGLAANVLDEPSEVFEIFVVDPRYVTAQGLHVGSMELDVRAQMGAPSKDTMDMVDDGTGSGHLVPQGHGMCYESGITFIVKMDGTVNWIWVHPTPATQAPQSRC